MKKTILLVFAALVGTNSRADILTSSRIDDTDVEAQQSAALAYLFQTGAIGVADDGHLSLNSGLVKKLRASGAIKNSSMVAPSPVCLEQSK